MRDLVRLLQDRSVIVSGGSEEERDALIVKAKAGWKGRGRTGVFSLKPSIKDDNTFLRAVARALPLTSPLGLDGSEMSLDQINDYWLEWPHERSYDSALIVWPEVHAYAQSKPSIFHAHLGHLLGYMNLYYVAGKCDLRFMLTSKNAIAIDMEAPRVAVEVLPDYFKWVPGRKSRTVAQLVELIRLP